MSNRYLQAVLILCAASAPLFSRGKALVLKVDYSGKAKWTYSVNYESRGVFTRKDSTSTLKTNMKCRLSGARAEGADKLIISVKSVDLTSEFLSTEVIGQIKQQLSRFEYPLSLVDGYPALDLSAAIPEEGLPEWNLYQQFAKLLPALPAKAVKPGFTWERTVTLPVNTDYGKVPCEVYRVYSYDSLSTDMKTAFISWEFRYAAEEKGGEGKDAMNKMPVSGKGRGIAVLDLAEKCIRKAQMDFETPVAQIGEVKVNWTEHAVFQYEPGK